MVLYPLAGALPDAPIARRLRTYAYVSDDLSDASASATTLRGGRWREYDGGVRDFGRGGLSALVDPPAPPLPPPIFLSLNNFQ